ncbi:hypothetical protein HO173_009167 [Letharia columbiana]|uniref:Uncharacterized protein n=1 Tax=Letharia columbiana TaxID=112416 RepID=A0A8H6FPW1_9LECA|nr:uncharacterized protein HO173_009167 [Letharia columbiana]KAF6232501.1 hypothetical protein HO173_009167 [Letharia columbiana]
MARAYQEAHIMDTLTASVKDLQTKTAELAKAKGYHEERIKNLTTANAELQKKYDALEVRMKANEHNTTARILNTHLSLSSLPNKNNIPLTPLHDLSTNRPLRNFPKHEKDIKTMGSTDVIQALQALDVPSLGLTPGEKKAKLRGKSGWRRRMRGVVRRRWITMMRRRRRRVRRIRRGRIRRMRRRRLRCGGRCWRRSRRRRRRRRRREEGRRGRSEVR